jgi:hypothetical protein
MLNKDLFHQTPEDFEKSLETEFIPDDFEGKLEWALLLLQQRFEPVRLTPYLPNLSTGSFDKAFLMINNDTKFLDPFVEGYNANPHIFPNINIKTMLIGKNGVNLNKVRELPLEEKRHVSFKNRNKYVYKFDHAYYKSDTEKFYTHSSGFTAGDRLFTSDPKREDSGSFPIPLALNSAYKMVGKLDMDVLFDMYKMIKMSYNVALSMYYEWTILLKDNNSIRIAIPFNPEILKEMFNTSMLKFDSRKRFIHFVRDHYRRMPNTSDDDYSVYIQRYLSGENKFIHNGFEAIVQPPKYELNRVKTKKKFEVLF